MKTIVAAFHPDLPHELQQGLLHRKDLRLVSVRTLPELIERLGRGADICLVGAQLGEHNAASISQALRGIRRQPPIPTILLLTGGSSAPPGTAQLFDESFEWPQQSGPLFLAMARHLGWAARESDRYPTRVHVFLQGGDTYLGSTIDLSQDGLLLRTTRPHTIGERLQLRFALPGRAGELWVQGRVLRCDSQTYAPDHAIGLHFESQSDEFRHALREYFALLSGGRSFRWKIARKDGRQIIHLSGVLNAEVDLAALKQLRGELDIYMRDFRRISSDSIQTWIDLMRSLTGASKIRLHECPIQFIQQANAISNLLDHTEVVSFLSPYLCSRCGLDEERLIDVRHDLYDASGVLHRRPPRFSCVRCDAEMLFDDIPERYFMFL